MKNLMKSLCLENKITEHHAKEIELLIKLVLKKEKQKALKEQKKLLERIKLELDVCVCDCGEKWSETDLADLVNQALKDLIINLRNNQYN